MITKESIKNIEKHYKLLLHGNDYAYIAPSDTLSHLISNYTITFPSPTMISDIYTILPHGSVTLVFFQNSTGLHSLLYGPTTKPITVGTLANTADIIFIIEFQPAGFYPFTSIKQNNLTDEILLFQAIDKSLDKKIKNIFTSSSTMCEVLSRIEHELLSSMQFHYPEELSLAMSFIIQKEGSITAEEIAEQTFYSQRHANRLFNMYLGMSLKSFSRLVRINKSIHLLNKKHSLSFICDALGYYDVAHYVKDFKIICGITPQVYKSNMSDFYSEIAKF